MSATRDDALRRLDIKPTDFVVEVGGGHEPFGSSSLIFDKYPFDNVHRVDDVVHRAPVIIADAVKVPLPDKGCDVLFASHVVEHLPDPTAFLEEIRRCSTNVYLEFPGVKRELMFAWSFHEWLVTANESHLVFYKNDIPQLFGAFFHENYDFLFDAWMMRRHLELNAAVYCSSAELTWSFAEVGAFEHVVASSPMGRAKVNEAPIRPAQYTWKQLATLALQRALPEAALNSLVGRWRRRRAGSPRPLTQQLVARLMCLRCRSCELSLEPKQVVCRECGAEYGQRRGLFNFDV